MQKKIWKYEKEKNCSYNAFFVVVRDAWEGASSCGLDPRGQRYSSAYHTAGNSGRTYKFDSGIKFRRNSTGLFTPGADLQPEYFIGRMFRRRACVFGLLLLLFANLHCNFQWQSENLQDHGQVKWTKLFNMYRELLYKYLCRKKPESMWKKKTAPTKLCQVIRQQIYLGETLCNDVIFELFHKGRNTSKDAIR